MDSFNRAFFKRPALFLLFPYIVGLIIGFYLKVPRWLLLSSIPALIVFLFITSIVRFRPYLLIPSLLIFLFTGVLFMGSALVPELPTHHIRNLIDGESWTIEGTLYKSPETLLDRMRVYVEIDEVSRDKRIKQTTGRMLLTIGDRDIELRYGDRIRFRTKPAIPKNLGNPGGFDYERFLLSRGILTKGYVKGGRAVVIFPQRRDAGLWSGLEGMRERLRRFLDKEVQGPENALLKALLLGEKGEIPQDIREVFIRTGIAHILAISGLHIGIVALVSFWIVYRFLRLSEWILLTSNIKKLSLLISVIPIILYGFIGGFSIPTQRAVVMALVFIFAILLDREKDIYNTVAVAALIILVFHPLSILDPSFQLSFAAVISIIYIVSWLRFKGEGDIEEALLLKRVRMKNWIQTLFFIPLAASIGTSPLIIFYFNRISILGFLANLLIVPIIGFIVVPLTLFSGFISFIYYPAAVPFIHISAAILSLAVKVAGFFSGIPYASMWVSTPSLLSIGLYYTGVVSLLEMKRRKGAVYVFATAASLFILYRFGGYLYERTEPNLEIAFISVGQGDSTLVEFPGGKTMLVDGGGIRSDNFDTGKRVIAPILWNKGINRIDYLVLTHPQADHLKGLVFIAENFGIGEFWWNGDKGELEEYGELMQILEKKGIKTRVIHKDTPSLYIRGIKVEPLHPPFGEEGLGVNDLSLVLRLLYKRFSLLLAGDIEKEGEEALLKSGIDIRAVAVKVPHHGSTTSSTSRFIKGVDPDMAIISVGCGNPFGFPRKQVLDRYRRSGVEIYRTDMDGAVTIETDGERVNVKTFYSAENGRRCE
ncbi:MAG: DNA internalization-related competence protein ComEC/Rec2 [Thermodesulfobacteriota bacterium]